ncbi:hypothetical protein PP178_06595 [Zeaxanthinibacter sp. PT1]|uniref:hypothetical protein n=1 Tax=Zeaxanthinibacter TaxID=561554 RepID=UPI00234A59CD|nr:hypothetical protein [Zeaxanthinibacter sp. PT1]MDC6351217.1 hypothetical protein [Zeaxanthinibacter sp. PT1]
MVKKIVTAILCFALYGVCAQDGTVSPYSYFGIGDLRSPATVDNQMMGRLGMYTDSIHVNFQNPAAYGKLRRTTYTAGLSHTEMRIKSFTDEESTSVTNLDYIAIGIPLGPKWGAGFGLQPYSSVGYNLIGNSINGNGAEVTNRFSGEGGLNKVYFSLGHELLKNLHIGATVNFNFGKIEDRREQTVEDVQFGTLDLRESRVNGYDFNYGATYSPKITDKLTLFSSLRINTQANLVSENDQRIGSFSATTGREIEIIDVDLASRGLERTEIKVPTATTLGLGVGEDLHWFVGAEYTLQPMSDFRNEFVQLEEAVYQDASSFSLGGFYIPDYTSFNNVFNRITYRAGLRMNNSGLHIRDKEIKDFGITFGLGIPLGFQFSNLNLGFEVGRRGTTVADLIEETYFKVNVGLSLSDRWFRKRQID